MRPSKSSLDRLPKEVDTRWEDDREAFERELREVTEIPEETKSIAVSLDGVLAPMKDGNAPETRERAAAEGRLSKGPAGYREVGCATVSFCDEDGEMISAIRMARMPETNKLSLKAMLIDELGSILAARPDLLVVKLADGAQDNWTFFDNAFSFGAEAIDFFMPPSNSARHSLLRTEMALGKPGAASKTCAMSCSRSLTAPSKSSER